MMTNTYRISMMDLITRGGLLSVLLISIVALSNQQEAHQDQDITAIKNQLISMSTNEKQRLEDEKKKEIDEFVSAIENKFYQSAAFKISRINDENKIAQLIKAACRKVGSNLLTLIEYIHGRHMKEKVCDWYGACIVDEFMGTPAFYAKSTEWGKVCDKYQPVRYII
ncbi:hypothetical protein O3M35_003051 [Rhynocoris fuscipes]|uniref:Uncharacterized protein n=1 Tax=Rhynocoris fuscipes TaxID=488301 RepID=A0AAW1CHN9_9HEMI